MNPITRVAVVAAAVVVAAGVAFLALRPVSDVGPPATASPAPPSIEGTWDVSYTHQEMLAAGIADQAEDNPDNYGHFRLTFEAGRWKADHLSPTTFNGGVSTYSVDGGIAHLYSPDDDTTFDIPYTVTATTLTFGQGGPVMFRVKPWTRVAPEPVPTEVPVNGDSFTLDALAPPSGALDAFIVRTLFEQTFTFVR